MDLGAPAVSAATMITSLQDDVERLYQRLNAAAAATEAHRYSDALQLLYTSVQHTDLIGRNLKELHDQVRQLDLFP